jgi:hypothetical protein
MKRTAVKLLIAAYLVLMAVGAAYEFRAIKAADYYSSRPERVVYALALTVLVGAAIFLYSRLPARAQRNAKLLALGNVAVFLSIFSGYMLFEVIRVASSGYVALVDGYFALFALLPVFWAALAAMFWYEFYHVLKRGKTRFL